MSGFIDVARVTERAARDLARLDAEQTRQVRGYLTTALRRTLNQTETAYRRAMTDAAAWESGAAFRLARGRVLADELEGTIRAIGTGDDAMLTGLLGRVEVARDQATGFVQSVLALHGDAITISTPVNHQALASVVQNASERLRRHGLDTIDAIKQDTVTALVRGDSWSTLSRQIRRDTDLLRTRADTIAITELHNAQADARKGLYADLGVELVQRYVTLDDRTCPYCSPRQGEVTKAAETVEVLHPRCRCVLAPFNPEWLLDDPEAIDILDEMRRENLDILDRLGIEPILTRPASFERATGRPTPVWTPGDPTTALMPWIGRAFAFPTRVQPRPAAVVEPPQAPTADLIEQSRTLPIEIRRQLAKIPDERADLVAQREQINQQIGLLRNNQTILHRQRAAMSLQDPGRAAVSDELDAITRRLLDATAQRRAIEDQMLDFGRRRAHEILSNANTGHANGRVLVDVQIRRTAAQQLGDDAASWIQRHATFDTGNTVTPIRRLPGRKARAYHEGGQVFVGTTSDVGTHVHELAHAIDYRKRSLVDRALAFLDSRTVGETPRRLRDITGNTRYATYEISTPDAFGLGAYVGRRYPAGRSSEILSMGLEAMYRDPVNFAKVDPGHFDWTLRIMKGLPDP